MADAAHTMGVDVGTGGARVVIADGAGRAVATGQHALSAAASRREAADRHEQTARAWWDAATGAMADAMRAWRAAGGDASTLHAIAVDATSGTLVPIDATGEAVAPAIMYNDGRAEAEANELNERFAEHCARRGYRFTASFAIAKALWLARHDGDTWQRTHHLAHHADYINSQLIGAPVATDYSNALKSGYDLVAQQWPRWMQDDAQLGEIRQKLPAVVAPGEPIGEVSERAAIATGLPTGLTVVAGATDGVAGFLASGAATLGATNTTLGTTLVFKRLADTLCTDPAGMIYSHKLPGNHWLPGAASSTGGEWVRAQFPGSDLAPLDRQAAQRLPTECVMYPLARTGERFPFKAAQAQGFCEPAPRDQVARYAAGLQGTALLERLCYDVLDQTTGATGGDVYATGGGSASDIWMQLRADVTGRVLHRPATPEAAFGMTVLAASKRAGGLINAMKKMVRVERTFEPDVSGAQRYAALYARFVALLRARGYINDELASLPAPATQQKR